MSGPTLSMNLGLLRGNVEAVVQAAAKRGVEIVGITKASHGSPVIGRALLESGVALIGESRLSNIRRLHEGGVDCPFMMLRLPSLSEAADVVKYCDVSLNSEVSVLKAL